MPSGRRLFLLVYAASGAAALVYEVAWTRMLTLQLGHTVAAASTVLAAFMGGLALGAWLIGRLPLRGLRAYAALETLVAVCALALPLALAASVPALAWAYDDGAAPIAFPIVRVAISLALLGLPAAAMGATFPVATDCLSNQQSRGSFSDSGALYAANTAGAAVGAIGAGFWLIPALGLRGTTWVGVALNLAAAAAALQLSKTVTTAATTHAKTAKPATISAGKKSLRPSRSLRSTVVLPPAPLLACSAAAISGFAALVYEVAWTRLLALVVGPTTYAFATMAAAFVSGLAIGSAIGTRVAQRVTRPDVWLASMLIVSSVSASLAAWFAATQMPLMVAAQVADPDAAFTQVILVQALGIGALLLPMTLALGATFPLALAVAAGATATAGRDAARVYSANTLGAIAGALAGGFALIPALGLRVTIETASIAGIVGGAGCLLAALRRTADRTQPATVRTHAMRALTPAALAVASIAFVALLPSWDHALLASGAYKYAPYLGEADLDTVLRAGTLDYYKEGAAGTVSVRQLNGTTSLAIDGKVDASNGGDMLTQRLLGLLPVLVHGHAKQICIIGLGSGVTVGSALASGRVEHADVVEISPEVVEASHHFDRESGRVLSNPIVHLIVGDGRSHLLLTPRSYDVIVSEPSNPWMAGVATLFTREFFEAARARLKVDGVLCQWAHTYDISAGDLRSIVRTFAAVFPQGTMWMVGGGDLLLIGAKNGDIAPRLAALPAGARAGTVTATLADVGIADGTAPFALLSQFAGGPNDIARYADAAPIQTDDRTALEYSAPRAIYGRSRDDNAAAIRALTPERPQAVADAYAGATDADWASRGLMQLKSQAFLPAYDAFREAVTRNSRNAAALSGLSDAAGGVGKLTEERDWLRGIAKKEPANAPVRLELSRVLAVTGDGAGAAAMAFDAVRLAPDDARAAEQLASVLADAGDADRLAPLADAMAGRFPDRPDPQYYRASALFMRGRNEDAATAARRVTDRFPAHARAQNLLGAACAALGRRDCALAAFEASIRANPRDPSAYVNTGLILMQSAQAATAVTFFASALTIDPTSKPARDGLAQARSMLANARD
jgi:spermidine synthase